ncbi:LOW QUALITY PROTEIN: nucleoside diphosphate-linked moiety X motif 17 [Mergus octosetaceus]
MAGLGRVLVHLQRGGEGGAARFGQSVTGAFCAPHEDAAAVSCGLQRGRFLLADAAFPGSTDTILGRPPVLPAKLLGPQAAAEPRGRGVEAAVAVLLQAATGPVLLTRRPPGLRVFPNVWVPPGGHVEPDEELLAVGLRELQEETGLRLAAGTFTWRLLGLWESVYPPMLSRGPPRRHHIVAYLLLREPHEELEARMPSESEVSAYAWLEPRVLEAIAATEDGGEAGRVPSTLPASVSITEVSGGSPRAAQLPTATLHVAPAEGEDLERVSTGTKFALRLWLEAGGGKTGAKRALSPRGCDTRSKKLPKQNTVRRSRRRGPALQLSEEQLKRVCSLPSSPFFLKTEEFSAGAGAGELRGGDKSTEKRLPGAMQVKALPQDQPKSLVRLWSCEQSPVLAGAQPPCPARAPPRGTTRPWRPPPGPVPSSNARWLGPTATTAQR